MRRLLLVSSDHQQHHLCNDDNNHSDGCPCHHSKKHIIIPPDYVVLTYPLNLTSHTTLQVDGRLVAIANASSSSSSSPQQQKWPIIPPLENYASSEDGFGAFTPNQYQPFLYATHATDIRITGRGVIDGNGPYWWKLFQSRDPLLRLGGRPNLFQALYCSNIELDSVTFENSAFWTIHPVLSRDIYIHHIRIRAPMYAPNVDGIDPDSCRNVLVEHCDVACGDDHIAIKAGVCGLIADTRYRNKCTGPDWQKRVRTQNYVTQNVTVRHNLFRTGMGVAVGSEMSGSVKDVWVYNNTIGYCEFGHDKPTSCGWGPALHIKTTITRSGSIENIVFENNTIYNTSMFIFMHTDYQVGTKNQSFPAHYPKTLIKNIVFRNNHALGMAAGASFECSPLDHCHNITVVNNTIQNAVAVAAVLTVNDGDDDDDDDEQEEDSGPWGCAFIESYHVADNYPSGLEKCMATSMNQSSAVFTAPTSSGLKSTITTK